MSLKIILLKLLPHLPVDSETMKDDQVPDILSNISMA